MRRLYTETRLAASTTDQDKGLVWWHRHRDGRPLPRIPVKIEGAILVADHSLPAARHGGAEGRIHGT